MRRPTAGVAAQAAAVALLLACSEGAEPEGSAGGEPAPERAAEAPEPAAAAPEAATPEREVVARVAGEALTRVELDAPLRLRLYELEREAYRLRSARLQRLALERLGEDPEALGREAARERLREAERSGELEILLAPPERPRLSVGAKEAPARGPQEAPVELVVFCDFASPHCARHQPALRALREAYPDRLRVAHRDAPRSYHRHAVRAAMAARCAGEQGAYGRYHDALYAHWDALSPERFAQLARGARLDAEAFERCLEEERTREAVERDAAIARRLGVTSVPVTFVNGLYVKGPVPEAELAGLVRAELERLGEDPEPASPEGGAGDTASARPDETDLPLELRGTLVADDPERSVALIRKEGGEGARPYRPGDRVMEDVVLDAVEPERAWVEHEGRRELLRLSRERRDGPVMPRAGRVLDAAPEPTGVVTLRREAVDRALEEREALARRLEPGRLDLEGRHLLKLQEVPEGSLYERMGLEPGDVLMQVNGRFVHDAENPLWEALRTQGRVELTVMRGGFPKTFAYAIE